VTTYNSIGYVYGKIYYVYVQYFVVTHNTCEIQIIIQSFCEVSVSIATFEGIEMVIGMDGGLESGCCGYQRGGALV
jgi:hypothetical protein